MVNYVIGLDWINAEHGWAYCQLPINAEEAPALGMLSVTDQEPSIIREALTVCSIMRIRT